MANWLGKTKTLDLTSPASPGRPGIPGTPYRAAWDEKVVQAWIPANPLEPGSSGSWVTYYTGYWTEWPSGSVRSLTVTHPAIAGTDPQPPTPPSPAAWRNNFHFGWNAGAESLGVFVGNMAYTFSVPADAAGVQTGLSAPAHNTGYTGTEIDYAWSVSQGEAKVVERGIFKTNGYPVTSATVFKVDRTAGVVTYLLDGVLQYTSLTASASFALIVDSSLYMGGDSIVDAAVTGGATPIGDPTPVTGNCAGSAAPPTGSASSLGAFASRCAGSAAPPTGRASSIAEFIPQVSVCFGAAAPPMGSAYGVVGVVGTCAGSAAPPTGYASNIPPVTGRCAGAAAPPYGSAYNALPYFLPSAPARFAVVGKTYSATAPARFACFAAYSASARTAFYVLGPFQLAAYKARAPARFAVTTDAVPYAASAPARFDCLDPTRYSRAYRASAPARFNVTGHYAASAKTRFLCLDARLQQASALSTAAPAFWGVRATVAGLDVTARLTGAVSIHCAEDAASVAEMTLLPFGGLVDLTRYVGQPCSIDYRSDPSREWHRRFTGLVDSVDYDPDTTLTRFTCTDGLQLAFERIAGESARLAGDAQVRLIAAENNRNKVAHDVYMASATITQSAADRLTLAADEAVAAARTALHGAQTRTGAEARKIVGGLWSWLIFTSQAGWDAFHDCLSTQMAAYNLDSDGTGALTSWAAKAVADFAFTSDGYVDSSLRVGQVANARSIVNSVDIKFEYRFTRLFEYTFPLQWSVDPTTVVSAAYGSRNWGLNDHKRVADALTGAGLCLRAQAGLYGKTRPLAGATLPSLAFAPVPEAGLVHLPAGDVFYGSDSPRYSGIAGFSCQALKRYRQTLAETVIHSVTYPQSIAQTGRMNRSVGHAVESKQQPAALLQEIVDGWDETASDALMYPVGKGLPVVGVSSTFATAPDASLTLNRYVFVQPRQKPDNTVKASIGGCQSWDITQSPIDGRAERDNAFAVARAVAIKTIAASHRQAEVSFDIPAHETLELSHTVEVSREAPAFQAKGKVKALQHIYDIVAGSALTTVTIALMKSWSTGAHYVDPYVPLPDVGTITYPGTLFRSQLTSWPEEDRALMGFGSAEELAMEPPASKRFRGYNWFQSTFTIEAPPVPQEAQASFVTVTRTSETVTLPDDVFVVAA